VFRAPGSILPPKGGVTVSMDIGHLDFGLWTWTSAFGLLDFWTLDAGFLDFWTLDVGRLLFGLWILGLCGQWAVACARGWLWPLFEDAECVVRERVWGGIGRLSLS
jgi:hypothetical protein